MSNSKRVVCIVQARMGSDRLPGKVMRPILGMPMIGYTLKRLAKCETVSETVLATSALENDTPLAEYAESLGFRCFRGSEDDVLERYTLANRQYGGDIVIRVTGDCPLIDPELVDLSVSRFLAESVDYLRLDERAAMRGMDTEVFSAETLEKTYGIVSKLENPENYKEHVTLYIYRHPKRFTVLEFRPALQISRPYRLCVDEIDDFKVVEAILNHFENPYPTINEIVEFLDSNTEIATLNKHVEQKKA